MQAFRSGALVRGSLRVVRGTGGGSRGSKGLGWYQRYQKLGPEAFLKARPPTPFDWEASTEGKGLEKSEGGVEVNNGEERRRKRAFFEMTVDGADAGRVEFELAADLLPVTCENFARLCRGVPLPSRTNIGASSYIDMRGEKQGDGEPMRCYAGTKIHHITKGMGIMGGDVEHADGARSHSSFETRFFPDEAFVIPHSEPGLLTMANSGVHSNGSQFFVTVEPAGHLDGRSVAFGRVVAGMDVIQALYSLFSTKGRPVSNILVARCGTMP
ncbi:unnamed protein product [Discosporangium mesarthrocarpum]